MSATIYWIRRDLRVDDNPALDWAVKRDQPIIPIYIHAPDEHGDWAPGAASRWALHQGLEHLSIDLARLGAPLVVKQGSTRASLESLIKAHDVSAVVWNRLYDPALVERDKVIKTWLKDQSIEAKSCKASLLFEPWSIETGQGTPYRVYTPFRKTVEKLPAPADPLPAPKRLDGLSSVSSLTLEQLDLMPRVPWYRSIDQHWTLSETAAHDMLEAFCDGALNDYDTDRDRPDRHGTSRLSPYLHFGQISVRRIWHECSQHPSSKSLSRYKSELIWREFAHHLLWHFPKTPSENYNDKFDRYPWKNDANHPDFIAWTKGETGIELVDAGMQELWHTGWMHNRVRMIVASFLTKNLGFHWRLGAQWFWDTLIDADLANNTLGWQWAAGCGADAAPFFRIFNPATQAEKFDPQASYRRRWLQAGRPDPMVDLKASRQVALNAYKALSDNT